MNLVSFYVPKKNIIDLFVCEHYVLLPSQSETVPVTRIIVTGTDDRKLVTLARVNCRFPYGHRDSH